jgi:hypothetical protein
MKKVVLLLALLYYSAVVFAQGTDTIKKNVSGAVTATSNGISLVPAFTLDKPAAIFDLAVRKNRFSFEPEWAFDFTAKPWYFVFWLRYKLIETSKFNMGVGFHPGFVFTPTNFVINGVDNEYLKTSRYFVEELAPTYAISDKFGIGICIYYQHSQGFNSVLRQSHFVGLNCNFSYINLGNKFYMRTIPEVYYLKNDKNDGVYFTSAFAFGKKNLPFSISSVINAKLRSTIPGQDFLWNVSLTYAL